MKEYLEIIEEGFDDLYPPEHVLVYVESEDEAKNILKEWKKTTNLTKWKAKHVKSKHEEHLPCEGTILEEQV